MSRFRCLTWTVAFCLLAAVSHALDLERRADFDIPAQTLSTALLAFSRQADVQIITATEQLQDLQTRGIQGHLTLSSALNALLEKSGLSFKAIGDSAISIGRFSPDSRTTIGSGALLTDAAGADALQEVVVTATRTSEPLRRVPISVVALNQAALDRLSIRDVDDIGRLTPGVDFDRNGFGLQSTIAIRGISSTVGSATTGIYIDETPIQSRTLGNSSGNAYPVVFDLDRVEVLRGPQGTLFGAASEGGNVRFITPEPSLDTYHGYVRGELAMTERGDPTYEAGAAVGGPIVTDTLAFRASVYYRRDGGYVDREHFLDSADVERNSNYLESTAVRLALKWMPADWITISPSIFYQQLYQNDVPTAWSILSDPAARRYASGDGSNSVSRDRFALPALNVRLSLKGMDLISNTSYYDRREATTYDYTLFDISYFAPGGDPTVFYSIPGYYSNSPQDNNQHNFVQEVRLQADNPDARVTWVVGGFYSNALQNAREVVNSPFLGDYFGAPVEAVFGAPLINGTIAYIDDFVNKDIETALFANVGLRITDKLRVGAGVRASRARFDYSEAKDGPAAGGPSSTSGSEKESPVTPKFTVSYQFNDETLLYASAARGYRVGGANPPIPNYPGCNSALASLGLQSAPLTYKSDSTWSYEVGTKSRLAGGRAEFAASAFYIDWSNIIQAIPALANCPFSFTTNLGRAVSKGFDLQADYNLGSHFTFGASASFTKAQYTQTVRAAGATQDLVTAGHTLGGSPWVLVGSAEFHTHGLIGDESYLRLVADYRSENDGRTSLNDPGYSTYDPLVPNPPAVTNVDLRAGSRFSGGWDLSLFAKNLLNQNRPADYIRDAVGAEVFHYYPPRPRTIGVTLSRQF